MNGTNTLQKRIHRDPKLLLPRRAQWEVLAMSQEDGSTYVTALVPWHFWAPEPWEINFCCLSHRWQSTLVTAALANQYVSLSLLHFPSGAAAAAAAKSLQLCPTLCDPMDCSPPGSSVHGTFQARVLALVVQNSPAMQEMQEMWVWSLGQEDSLEKEMATHSNSLVREIPWTEEPGSHSPWNH